MNLRDLFPYRGVRSAVRAMIDRWDEGAVVDLLPGVDPDFLPVFWAFCRHVDDRPEWAEHGGHRRFVKKLGLFFLVKIGSDSCYVPVVKNTLEEVRQWTKR